MLFAMDLTSLLQFLEPFQEQIARVYSIGSMIFSVLIVLWLFNFIAGVIQKIYSTGKIFGAFYRRYLHRYLRGLLVQLLQLFKSKANLEKLS